MPLFSMLNSLPALVHMNDVQHQPGNVPSVPRAQIALPGAQIQEHYFVGMRVNEFVCSCGEAFSSRSNLTRHSREIRLKAAGISVQCPLCEHKTSRGANIITHFKALHADEYHAKCNICGKWIYQIADLTPHYHHPKGYSIKCGICGMTFQDPDTYEDHMRRKHPRP